MSSIDLDSAEREVLGALTRQGVRFVIVGSTAAMSHDRVGSRQDLDLAIEASNDNAARVIAAMRELGQTHSWGVAELCQPRQRLRLRLHTVDLLTTVDGVGFDELYRDREMISLDTIRCGIASLAHVDAMAQARPRRITVFVRLLDEGVECWRPTEAIEEEPGRCRLLGPVPDLESWEFQPNQVVLCEKDSTGSLMAISLAT